MPVWDGSGFAGGYGSVREVFDDFVQRYGVPGPGSAAVDAADLGNVPDDDITGASRGADPDVGAVER